MPAGVGWSQYLKFSAASMISMFAGAQLVHLQYKPLQDLNDYINKELHNLPENIQHKIKKELQEEGVIKS